MASQRSWHLMTPYQGRFLVGSKTGSEKEYDCNNYKISDYLAEVRRMEKFFDRFEIRYVPHLDNRDADPLSWIASSRAPTLPDGIIEKLSKPSVKLVEKDAKVAKSDPMVIDKLESEPAYDWMNPIKMFLEN
jgi:hypothetical protein